MIQYIIVFYNSLIKKILVADHTLLMQNIVNIL